MFKKDLCWYTVFSLKCTGACVHVRAHLVDGRPVEGSGGHIGRAWPGSFLYSLHLHGPWKPMVAKNGLHALLRSAAGTMPHEYTYNNHKLFR